MACSSCKSQSPVNNVKWGVFIFGIYIFASSIYGTVELVKKLISLF